MRRDDPDWPGLTLADIIWAVCVALLVIGFFWVLIVFASAVWS